MKKSIIATDTAPQALGAYSQAVATEAVRLVFVSGQIGLEPSTMELVDGGVAAEARQVLLNIQQIMQAAGGTMASIIKMTIYLTDIKDFIAVNEVYASFFEGDFPARAAVAVTALPKGARVEIEAVAALA